MQYVIWARLLRKNDSATTNQNICLWGLRNSSVKTYDPGIRLRDVMNISQIKFTLTENTLVNYEDIS
jgi:hypothetical protein